jgi:hypothetical protein
MNVVLIFEDKIFSCQSNVSTTITLLSYIQKESISKSSLNNDKRLIRSMLLPLPPNSFILTIADHIPFSYDAKYVSTP